jgi:membrane-associated phospholipid phosphatase
MIINNEIFFFFYNLAGAHGAGAAFSYNWPGTAALILSYPFFYGSLLLLFVWAVLSKWKSKRNFYLLFGSAASAWVLDAFLKLIFQVPRPFQALSITPLFREPGFSFPSEHAAVYSAIAVAMFAIDRRAGWIFSVLAVLVGLSRMVVGVHYPFDVLVGFALGAAAGLFFIRLVKKMS